MEIKEHVSLAPLTTFHIGGEARYFAVAQSVEDVTQALAFVREHDLAFFILGGGSNILVADEGFSGLVLQPELLGMLCEDRGDSVVVTIGAGVSLDEFVAQMVERGYAGLESLSGIPGTVGGAVVANAGAYGAACSDVLVSVQVIDLQNPLGGVQTFKNNDCNFSYHDSLFGQQSGRYLILDATFDLAPQGTPDFSYRDNRFNFNDILAAEHLPQTLAGLRSAVLSIREKKGSLEKCYKSAGSFFHMPVISAKAYARILTQAQELDSAKEERSRPWAWEQTRGDYKIAPGFLLEYTQFIKGYTRGAVGISPRHTLSIINLGGAQATDVAGLALDMQKEVEKLFGLRLEREVEYVGDVEHIKNK